MQSRRTGAAVPAEAVEVWRLCLRGVQAGLNCRMAFAMRSGGLSAPAHCSVEGGEVGGGAEAARPPPVPGVAPRAGRGRPRARRAIPRHPGRGGGALQDSPCAGLLRGSKAGRARGRARRTRPTPTLWRRSWSCTLRTRPARWTSWRPSWPRPRPTSTRSTSWCTSSRAARPASARRPSPRCACRRAAGRPRPPPPPPPPPPAAAQPRGHGRNGGVRAAPCRTQLGACPAVQLLRVGASWL